MFVRSMYASVPFELKHSADKIIDKKLKDFRKDAKDFLVPKEVRGLNGQIMAKVRRLSIYGILRHLRMGLLWRRRGDSGLISIRSLRSR